jgi:hypothetical protein
MLLWESLNYLVADPLPPHDDSQSEQIADCMGLRPADPAELDLPEEELRARARERGRAERQEQAGLLREVMGNPFRYDPAPLERELVVDPAVLAWQAGRVEQVAGEIYRSGRFERVPELAGLLQAAGCSDQDLLRHCLRPAGHVRGCWAVDLLLGKS